ncbi:hypothetical protein ACFYYV_35160, partial [Streptomyces sp. NPDC001978]
MARLNAFNLASVQRTVGLSVRALTCADDLSAPAVFTSPADFNGQLAAWLQVANRRVHRTLNARPADRWEADRAAMLPLPPT